MHFYRFQNPRALPTRFSSVKSMNKFFLRGSINIEPPTMQPQRSQREINAVRIDPVPPALTSRLVPLGSTAGSSDLHSKPKFIRFGHFQSIFPLSSV
ncbi:hypothetical protein CDAR_593431 [Caerostris darwini]|uniref:Uncharacterized protein n=1 Tax=Caerostris darwini TaxID=1538125 RepID=A0AAV4T5F3_9ARAC|nr:hypothetical protein CDAR_593431 [Caerostris darwini]